jgi:hypothetical protein
LFLVSKAKQSRLGVSNRGFDGPQNSYDAFASQQTKRS